MNESITSSIKQAREKAGFTQAQVEEALSLRKLALKDYETGRIKLPVEMAVKLASFYHITVDELINQSTSNKKLIKLTSLFHASEMEKVFLDPVIRAYLESYTEILLTMPLYDLLIINLNQKERKEFHNELMSYLYSLVGIDGKILSVEIGFLNEIDGLAKTKTNNELYKNFLINPYYRNSMNQVLLQNITLRHFIIWVLFFLAQSDNEITSSEINYIETIAEELKILKSNYISIKEIFIKES
jgi:transcriptional regulator with XRE-family HTH domain